MLHGRTKGLIPFFLSSDGQSLPFGENWSVELSDALKQAGLMFVFMSEHSINSRWVLFESGGAFLKGIRVVPVGLPGMEVSKLGTPLSPLHGFNLHSRHGLANVVRIINETYGGQIDERSAAEAFEKMLAAV